MRSFVRNPDNNSGNTLKLKEIKNSDGRELNLMATRNYSSSTVTHMRSHNKCPWTLGDSTALDGLAWTGQQEWIDYVVCVLAQQVDNTNEAISTVGKNLKL